MFPLRQGRIVYTVVFDQQGKNPKRRPVILITPPGEVPEGQLLLGVAVSTQPTDPLHPEEVRLPSNRRKQGSSQLPERCAAVCDWVVQFYEKDIEEVGGIIYGSLLLEIVKKVGSYLEKTPPPMPPPSDDSSGEPT